MKLFILIVLQKIFLVTAADIPLCVANTNPEAAAALCMSCSAADANQCTPCSQDACMNGVYSIQFDDKDAWSMTHLTMISSSKDAKYDPEQVTISGSNNFGDKWTKVTTKVLLWTGRSLKNTIFFDNEKKYKSYQIELRKLDGTRTMYIEDIQNPKIDPPPTEAPTDSPTNVSLAPTGGPSLASTGGPSLAPTGGPSLYEFNTKNELQLAVNLWTSDKTSALQEYGDIQTWRVHKITSMDSLFKDKKTFNEDISQWDTSAVQQMYHMFLNAHAFNSNLSDWNVSSVKRMDNMFAYASVFNFNLSDWNISAVTEMRYMFRDIKTFDQVLCWDTSNARVDNMFLNTKGGKADPNC